MCRTHSRFSVDIDRCRWSAHAVSDTFIAIYTEVGFKIKGFKSLSVLFTDQFPKHPVTVLQRQFSSCSKSAMILELFISLTQSYPMSSYTGKHADGAGKQYLESVTNKWYAGRVPRCMQRSLSLLGYNYFAMNLRPLWNKLPSPPILYTKQLWLLFSIQEKETSLRTKHCLPISQPPRTRLICQRPSMRSDSVETSELMLIKLKPFMKVLNSRKNSLFIILVFPSGFFQCFPIIC